MTFIRYLMFLSAALITAAATAQQRPEAVIASIVWDSLLTPCSPEPLLVSSAESYWRSWKSNVSRTVFQKRLRGILPSHKPSTDTLTIVLIAGYGIETGRVQLEVVSIDMEQRTSLTVLGRGLKSWCRYCPKFGSLWEYTGARASWAEIEKLNTPPCALPYIDGTMRACFKFVIINGELYHLSKDRFLLLP